MPEISRRHALFCILIISIGSTLGLFAGKISAQLDTRDTAQNKIPPVKLERTSQTFEPGDTNQIGLADLDGDGDLDAVFSNQADHHSRILWNDGKGRFIDSGQRLTQQGHGVGIGDLDGDNDLDLFFTCAGWAKQRGAYNSLPSRVYFNDGSGRFRDSGQDLGDLESSGNGIRLLDLDGDGDLDAHIYYYTSKADPYFHRIYLNDGKGRFEASGIKLPEGTLPAWGDLDGDGKVDAFLMEWERGLRVLLGDGRGGFEEAWREADPSLHYNDTALGDLDADGDLDAVVTASGDDREKHARVLLNDGRGRFEDKGLRFYPGSSARITLGDMNGDGTLDAFVTRFRGTNQLWLNDGSGRFQDSGLRMCEGDPNARPALGDLDGDGDLDAFIAFYGDGSNSVWINKE